MKCYKPDGRALRKGEPGVNETANIAVKMSYDALVGMKDPLVMVECGGNIEAMERQVFVDDIVPTLNRSDLIGKFKADRITVVFIEDGDLTHLLSIFKPWKL